MVNVMHHLINEQNQKEICPYCKRNLDGKSWKSEFNSDHHYKTTMCGCGKTISIKMSFYGSGHDDWQNKKLEDKIEQIRFLDTRIKGKKKR